MWGRDNASIPSSRSSSWSTPLASLVYFTLRGHVRILCPWDGWRVSFALVVAGAVCLPLRCTARALRLAAVLAWLLCIAGAVAASSPSPFLALFLCLGAAGAAPSSSRRPVQVLHLAAGSGAASLICIRRIAQILCPCSGGRDDMIRLGQKS